MQHKHPADIRLAVVISGINEKKKQLIFLEYGIHENASLKWQNAGKLQFRF